MRTKLTVGTALPAVVAVFLVQHPSGTITRSRPNLMETSR